MKILNFGSLNLDRVYRVEHFVKPGETLKAKSEQTVCGGKGLNQSIALARAGASVYHAGCVGKDGEALLQALAQNGVDTNGIYPVETPQGNAVIQVDDCGENCIIVSGGSNRAVTESMVNCVLQKFERGDWLILQNEINNLPYIIESGFAKGLKIVLNPSPVDEELKKVDFGKLEWLIVNRTEAERLFGAKSADEAWSVVRKRYPHLSLIVTLGESGSVCYTQNQVVMQSAFSVKAVDTTAAGDTFTGYFIASLLKNLEIENCLKRAAAAAAVCVSRSGASISIPTDGEVDEFLWHNR